MTNRAPAVAQLFLLGCLLLAGLAPAAVQAQAPRDSIPRNPDAELMFEQGVAAYERGDYQTAAERFRLAVDYPLNRTTTAALLMRGKTLVQLGRYQGAIEAARTLLDQYPNSSYRTAAERVQTVAQNGRRRAGPEADTLHIGILLPMDRRNVALSQALFNGIRLGVDEHNGLQRRYVPPPGVSAPPDSFDVYDTAAAFGDSLAAAAGSTTVVTATDTVRVDSLGIVTERVKRPDWIAKMHFRRTGADTTAVRAAVDSLVRQSRVDVIVGPLYSETASIAGGAAEQAEVLMVPPLATAQSVSAGRDHVFQTNPTVPVRGRAMARFAKEGLLMDSVAVAYEQFNPISARMAAAFRKEARQRDLGVPFELPLRNMRDWSRLPEVIEDDSTITDTMIARSEAFYLPISGESAAGKAQDALTGIGRIDPSGRVLGNAEWHDLPIRQKASQFTVTYTNDFNVQPKRPAVQAFARRYRILTGTAPDNLSPQQQRLAYTGYDVARFLLTTLSPTPGRPQPVALRSASQYDGLGTRIDFEGGTVNKALFYHRYRDGRLELLR